MKINEVLSKNNNDETTYKIYVMGFLTAIIIHLISHASIYHFFYYLFYPFRYYHKIPEDLPELEMKATFGLAAPIPFEVPQVHHIFTEEAYKDFTVQETAPPKIVSNKKL